jgi:hypothetical protein
LFDAPVRRPFGAVYLFSRTWTHPITSPWSGKKSAFGKPTEKTAPTSKDNFEILGFRVVYADFATNATLQPYDVAAIAKAAIQSVVECLRNGHPFMNGVRYLAENIEWGVHTDLTNEYKRRVLDLTRAGSLAKAERKCLSSAVAVESRGK